MNERTNALFDLEQERDQLANKVTRVCVCVRLCSNHYVLQMDILCQNIDQDSMRRLADLSLSQSKNAQVHVQKLKELQVSFVAFICL